MPCSFFCFSCHQSSQVLRPALRVFSLLLRVAYYLDQDFWGEKRAIWKIDSPHHELLLKVSFVHQPKEAKKRGNRRRKGREGRRRVEPSRNSTIFESSHTSIGVWCRLFSASGSAPLSRRIFTMS